ncbi:tetratricopeptide repeat protein [Paracoccus cavernae]|uniref:Tetratricopeptide repeat protein n=1 Tax=Paracoccus cavernae TaxID=1571207 RepID=A0ABT8DFM2_9RHOB|nr:tetratricopeptide repeat protein [Paracoccus cavernae]
MSAACDAAPDHLPFQLRRCGLLRQAGQIARAQDLAVELHQRQPDLPGLQAELAFIAQADGRPFDCLAACSAALAQTPGDARLVLEKINALTALRRYSEALAQAEAFLAATPDHPAIQLRRGCLLYQLGRAQESIRFLSALAQQQPHNAHILLNLARAYRHGQQHVASLAILDRLLAQDPQHCGALQEKLETLHLAGHAEELSRLVQELADHWAVAVQSAQRLAFGRLLCRGLAHLADDQAGELLRRNRDRLVTLGTELSVDLIWPIYRRADLMGHGPQFDALARALMDKDKIGLSTARAILQASYRAGIPHWHRIGLHVSDRVPAIDRARVLMDLAALSGLPAKALALRHKSPARAGADAGLQIAMLLRQQGRSRVAARYLGLVWRHPRRSNCAAGIYQQPLWGRTGCPRQVLAAATLRQPEMSPNWRRVIAQGWAELDHLSRATDLWAEGDAAMIPHADWYVANALSRTEAKALNPLRQRLWRTTRGGISRRRYRGFCWLRRCSSGSRPLRHRDNLTRHGGCCALDRRA